MKIVLLGANGQLAFDLKSSLATHELLPLTRSDFDVTNTPLMRSRLFEIQPDVIINTTAFHQVDLCESRPGDAFNVNAVAVFHLALIASEVGARLVHLSTDYVFDGQQHTPYTEDSFPRPISVYGNSKLAGENFVQSICSRHLLVRTCGLYGIAGSSGKGENFVETMIRKARMGEGIRVVSDQIVGPTPTADLAEQIGILIETEHYGLFHASSEGSCSWFDFATAIFELSSLEPKLEPTIKESYRTPASRPPFSVLENQRLKKFGINRMRGWREGLADYLKTKHGFGK